MDTFANKRSYLNNVKEKRMKAKLMKIQGDKNVNIIIRYVA